LVRYSTSGRGFSSTNPIANALVIVIGALAIGASIVLGFFAFIVLASIVLIMASVIGIRVWWFNRKLQKAAQKSSRRPQSGGVIEGEYHVIIEDKDEPR
jgi:membrane protein implicated in regulation of membrane protease activity